MSYRTSFLLLTGLMPIFCSCHDNNRFEWKVAQKHMEVSLNKESDSLYVIHLDTDRPSHSTWKLPYPVNLIMEILQETEFPKSSSELSNRQDLIPNRTNGYLFTGLQMKLISVRFG